jgi:pyridoxine kinase
MYVASGSLEAMKRDLVPIADTITPNAYEAMWLTGKTMRNQGELREVVRDLHGLGPKNVVISSTEWNHRITFFSWEKGNVQQAIESQSIPQSFDGPGDAFAALLLANSIKFPGEYTVIAERTVNSVFGILQTTANLGSRDLQLPAALGDIVNPPTRFRVMSEEEFDALEIVDMSVSS